MSIISKILGNILWYRKVLTKLSYTPQLFIFFKKFNSLKIKTIGEMTKRKSYR